MSGDLATETVAGLVASGRTAGEVQLRGTVTGVDERVNKAENRWAVLTLDDGTGVIEVCVFPRPWLALKASITQGRPAALIGRLNQDSRTGRLQLYATAIARTPH
jgi:DNA polymerase III alpha subunit